MSITATYQQVTPAANAWLVQWETDELDPTVRIYVAGRLWAERVGQAAGSELITLDEGDHVEVEIRDDGLPPRFAASGTDRISWFAIAGAAQYVVEKWNGSSWDEYRRIDDDGDTTQYAFTPDPLPDDGEALYRVKVIDAAGNEGTPGSITRDRARHPAAPEVAFSYDEGTGDLTVAAAA